MSTPGPDAAGTAGGAAAAGTPPAAADFISIRDAARDLGVDVSAFGDDQQALAHLAAAYRERAQLQQLAQLGQQVLPQWEAFQRFRQQQAQPQTPEKPWWNPPDYDPRWETMIVRDPQTGQLSPAPGAPPDIVQRYTQAKEHQLQFLHQFSRDPITAIKPGIEQLIRSEAERLVKEQLGGYRDQVEAQQFIEQNGAWLHQHDGQGQIVTDPLSGRPVLSEWGKRFAGYVQEAANMGLAGTTAQRNYALGLVQRDFLLAKQQAAPTGDAARQQANEQFLQQASGQAPAAPAPTRNVTPAPSQGGSIAERLSRAFVANGFQLASPVSN